MTALRESLRWLATAFESGSVLPHSKVYSYLRSSLNQTIASKGTFPATMGPLY